MTCCVMKKKRSVLYKVVMVCLILLLPLLGVSIYYAIKNRHLRRRCSV
ncbi:PLDc N-terminal domain-containing protein [Tannerella forsythia]